MANLSMMVRSKKAESISVCILSKAGVPSSRISSTAHLQYMYIQLNQTNVCDKEKSEIALFPASLVHSFQHL